MAKAKRTAPQGEYYPVKTVKHGNVYVARNVAGPPPYGWGTSFGEIKQAINKHDGTQQIAHDGQSLRIFKKLLTSTGAPSCHALVFMLSRRRLVVDVALRIYPDFCPEIEDCSPLKAAQDFAERFGREFQVGEKSAKFFMRETIPVPRDTEVVSMPPGGASALCFHAQAADRSCSVVLGFCIDVPSYVKALAGR